MPLLTVSGIGKVFEHNGVPVQALTGLSFAADSGEVLVIRGPNGCGKTTLLNIIAGLETPTTGRIAWGNSFTGRPVAYVMQNYGSSLLPWLTLAENILLPLRLQRVGRREQRDRLRDLNSVYDVSAIPLERLPAQASGGQKQRACIARALFSASPAALLDEPFSALDERGHGNLMALIETLRERERRLIVMVLHDLDDAILLADRLLILGAGASSLRADVRVELSRPRSYEQRLSPEFIDLRNRVLEHSRAIGDS